MENMEGLGIFFLLIIPVCVLFILLTTAPSPDEEVDSQSRTTKD